MTASVRVLLLPAIAFACLAAAASAESSTTTPSEAGAASGAGAAPNTLTESERMAGWRLLFDGDDLDQWRGYNKDDVPDIWSVEDGVVKYDGIDRDTLPKRKNGKPIFPPRGDLMTREQFDAFELSLEYRISPGGNSGIMFHVVEQDGKPPWHSAPEIQVQDNVDGHDPQKAGWLYQLYQPPTKIPMTGQADPEKDTTPIDATRPAGEWNQVTLKLTGSRGEVNVNGVRYYTFQLGSDDWNKRVAESKFSKFEEFAKAGRGHIVLQDHGDAVAYRNIKIRDLSDEVSDPVGGTVEGVSAERAFPNLTWKDWEPYTERGKQVSFIPVLITGSGDGSGRLFVVDQKGTIYSFDERPDVTESTVFMDIDSKVAHRGKLGDEEGLLGLAFHPEFASNGRFYVYYTLKDPEHMSVISEVTVKPDDPAQPSLGTADLSTERELMRVQQPFGNHNGGTLCFDADGKLCIAFGDGGAFYDPFNNAQDLTTPFGSVLRIDVDTRTGDKPYGIPDDNPFASGKTDDGRDAMPELFAYGFRNPWRLMLDPPTGTLWIGDVGQNLYEEINLVVAGGNYGWNYFEGFHPFGGRVPPEDAAFVDPVWEYDHEIGKSICGGTFYRGSSAPKLEGKYIYGDYVTGKMFALGYDFDAGEVTSNESITTSGMPIITFGTGDSGELYFSEPSGDGRGILKFVQGDGGENGE